MSIYNNTTSFCIVFLTEVTPTCILSRKILANCHIRYSLTLSWLAGRT